MDKGKRCIFIISIVAGSFAIILSNQRISVGQTSALASRQIETEGFQQQIDDMRLEILRLSQKLSESVAGKQELTKNDVNRLNVFAPGLKSLKIGGETRVRFEANANFDFDDSNGDGKEFTLLRTRLNFDAEINDHIRAFLELQDNRLFGEEADAGPTASDFATGFPLFLSGSGGGTIGNLNRVDVLQSYIDVSLFERESSKYDASNLSFRIGRWRMNYGGQKIISPLDWLNQGRAWDGVRMRYEQKRWAMPFWVDVFATQLDEDFVDAGRGGEDEDKIFTGIYGHLDWQKGHVAEPYILYRRSKGTTTRPDGILASLRASGRTNEERTTLGIHVHGKLASIPGLQYAGEFAAQFGTINGDGVRNLNIEDAYGGYAQVSYTKENWNWKPQIGYAFHFASGDDDPTDGDIGTFDQIYPLVHAYLGYIDFQGWQNVISHQFSLSVKPIRNMLAKIDFHLFEQENEDDAWYGVGGAPNGGFSSAAINAVNADDEIGQEIDVTLKYKLFDRLNVTLGYSHFFAGDLIDDVTGDDDGADWFYFMTSVKF